MLSESYFVIPHNITIKSINNQENDKEELSQNYDAIADASNVYIRACL
jgi:hypothetical protein